MQYLIPKEGFNISFIEYFLRGVDFEKHRSALKTGYTPSSSLILFKEMFEDPFFTASPNTPYSHPLGN
jgi:hypothetical protein